MTGQNGYNWWPGGYIKDENEFMRLSPLELVTYAAAHAPRTYACFIFRWDRGGTQDWKKSQYVDALAEAEEIFLGS